MLVTMNGLRVIAGMILLALVPPLPAGNTPFPGTAKLQVKAQNTKLHGDYELRPDKGVLLIARRDMPDPRFRRTVVLLAAHDKAGSLGLIINRVSTATLGRLLPEVSELDKQGHRVYFGGPVDIERLKFLVRNNDEPEDAIRIMGNLYISGSHRTLTEMLERNKTRNEFRIYLGYAGWGPNQLADELDRDDWHLRKAKMEDIFSADPDTMWEKLIDIYDPKGQLVELGRPAMPAHDVSLEAVVKQPLIPPVLFHDVVTHFHELLVHAQQIGVYGTDNGTHHIVYETGIGRDE